MRPTLHASLFPTIAGHGQRGRAIHPPYRFQAPVKAIGFGAQSQQPKQTVVGMVGAKAVDIAALALATVVTSPKIGLVLETACGLVTGNESLQFIPKGKMRKLFPEVQPITLRSLDGTRLNGAWLPAIPTNEPGPANRVALLQHGYTDDYRTMLPLALELRKRGVSVLMFDFRAHGGSAGTKTSLGYHETLDVVAGIKEAVKLAKAGRMDGAPPRVYYLGHSMGGAAGLMTPYVISHHSSYKNKYQKDLNEALNSLAGVISDSTFDHIDIGSRPELQMKANVIVDRLESMAPGFLGLETAFKDLKPAEMYVAAAKRNPALHKIPVMVLHGELDDATPVRHASLIGDKLRAGGLPVETHVMPNTPHNGVWELEDGSRYKTCFRGKNNGEEMLTLIEGFMARNP